MRPAESRAPGRSRQAVLSAATEVLVHAPQLSLGEVAGAIGIGRSTLHRLFPTRRDLLLAMAHDALDQLADVYRAAGFGSEPVPPEGAVPALTRLVDGLIPLGPRLMFLLRASELDGEAEMSDRVERLDEPVRATIRAAQQHGDLAPDVPAWWAVELLFAGVYVAWEQIQRGRLAPLDAPGLVMRSWLRGLSAADRTA